MTKAKPTAASQPEQVPTHTFVYISRAQIEGDPLRELVRVEAQARPHNVSLGVRGALVYMGGFFMQWLEGPQDALVALRERIARDRRHSDFHELLFALQPAVLAEDWVMCVAKRTEPPEDIRRRARSIVLRARRGHWTAADLMRRFTTPTDLASSRHLTGVYRHSRVCVVATNSIWPSALIRHVADTAQAARISRTWFSPPARADDAALTEYVDVAMLRGASMRISCMSGWMVPSPLFQLLNQEVQVLAMLFRTASAAATLEYAQKILGAASLHLTRPAVIGVFSPKSTSIAEIFQEYATKQGYAAAVVYSHLAEPTAVWDAIRAAANQFFVEHEWAPTTAHTQPATIAPQEAAPWGAAPAPATVAPPPAAAELAAAAAASADASAVPPLRAFDEQDADQAFAQAALDAPVPHVQRLTQTAHQLFSTHTAVQSWTVWDAADLTKPAGSAAQAPRAPVQMLGALQALGERLAPGELLESTSQETPGVYQWLTLMPPSGGPKSAARYWVRVLFSDPDLNPGMVQYLTGQWKDELLRSLADELPQ